MPKNSSETDDKPIPQVRVEKDVYLRLENEAKQEGRSITKQLDYILRKRYDMKAAPSYNESDVRGQLKDGKLGKIEQNKPKGKRNRVNGEDE